MKVLLIFSFYHYIWFIDSKNLCLILKKNSFSNKNDKVLTFDIVHFPNFEISAFLYLAPHSNKHRT